MKYIEVTIYTTKHGLDPLTCILTDMGIAGFVVEDAADVAELMNKKNDYDWDYVDPSVLQQAEREESITFYLEESEISGLTEAGEQGKQPTLREIEAVLAELRRTRPDFGNLRMEANGVDDGDWKDQWKAYFKPKKITDRLTVMPTWESYEGAEDELIIQIDPGMAFGTGTHETSSLCLRLLEKYLVSGQDTVLDVGCGSGILSIAAALLEAKTVKGIEIDPLAVEVAKENVELNGLTDRISVVQGDLTKGLDDRVDLVVANLMADLVILLSADVAKHLKDKGLYISSGILVEKRDLVKDAIQKSGFMVVEILEDGEWCAIVAQKVD